MHQEDDIETLPDDLLIELRKADKPGSLITASVDRSIAKLAHEQFSSRPERRRQAAPVWLAVAATLLLAVFILPLPNRPESGGVDLYGDVDNSGQVDIADVLALARRTDGKPTQAELDAFAMRIVSLADSGDAS